MPRSTDRACLLKDLENLIRMMMLFDDDKTEDFEDMMELYSVISGSRYIQQRTKFPKSIAFCNGIFDYPDASFRTIARCTKDTFLRLLHIVQDHPIFQNNSLHKQAPVHIQLIIVLNRLGCDGNGASIDREALLFGKSIGTIEKYTDRVLTAILAVEKNYVYWPDAVERRKISKRMYRSHGLKNAVGVVDGTPINFYQRPGIDGECFFTRKGRYALNLQLICDDKGFIRYYIVGYTGPTPDNDIITKSWILKTPEKFFSAMEYLLADAGYGLCEFICTPYRHPLAAVPRNQLFNVLYSSGRVIIEHVNGRIKSRFGSLMGVRILVQKLVDFERVNKWIVVCIILYSRFH
jgi:hypothetical protein